MIKSNIHVDMLEKLNADYSTRIEAAKERVSESNKDNTDPDLLEALQQSVEDLVEEWTDVVVALEEKIRESEMNKSSV